MTRRYPDPDQLHDCNCYCFHCIQADPHIDHQTRAEREIILGLAVLLLITAIVIVTGIGTAMAWFAS